MWKVTHSTREEIFLPPGSQIAESGTHDDNLVNISAELRLLSSQSEKECEHPTLQRALTLEPSFLSPLHYTLFLTIRIAGSRQLQPPQRANFPYFFMGPLRALLAYSMLLSGNLQAVEFNPEQLAPHRASTVTIIRHPIPVPGDSLGIPQMG